MRRRFVAAGAVTLVLSGSAAAAVVIVTEPSAPLSARFPNRLLGARYSLKVIPDLAVGHAGWCITLRDVTSRGSLLPNPGTCVAARNSAVITSGAVARVSSATGRAQGSLLYAVVDQQVSTLEAPGGARVRPITSAGLPEGWRAAVVIERRESGHQIMGLTPLNRRGAPIRTNVSRPAVLATRTEDPATPSSPCRIEINRRLDLRGATAVGLSDALPSYRPGANGFLSCYEVTFTVDGRRSVATLLVDEQRPGARPPNLPGLARVRSRPDVWTASVDYAGQVGSVTGKTWFAKRVSGGWLVLQTSALQARALNLLEGLTGRG